MSGSLIYSACPGLCGNDILRWLKKQKGNKTNNWPSNNIKGGYLVTIRKHWSWQAAEFIRFTLASESNNKKCFSFLLYALERLSDTNIWRFVFSYTYLHNTLFVFLPLWSKRSLGKNERYNTLCTIKHAEYNHFDVKISVSSHVFKIIVKTGQKL